ncbi:hypothetical protein Salat_2362000 [Sesamum alatum]|uniref:Uncharacterized protein n=1 Tax=Sesamum alatum TaxID=300844 RepID=A0AAE1XXN9_9LAMI|nr:hypothetical protein Salat_2362000 [Sesamum alatum]
MHSQESRRAIPDASEVNISGTGNCLKRRHFAGFGRLQHKDHLTPTRRSSALKFWQDLSNVLQSPSFPVLIQDAPKEGLELQNSFFPSLQLQIEHYFVPDKWTISL